MSGLDQSDSPSRLFLPDDDNDDADFVPDRFSSASASSSSSATSIGGESDVDSSLLWTHKSRGLLRPLSSDFWISILMRGLGLKRLRLPLRPSITLELKHLQKVWIRCLPCPKQWMPW
ncbi:uncharacterized protein LOC120258184 [Dioscorea cayenensis subsp. rotundata]|uniref:Uncharacterized protein LOC120258184 n=1 Tax=Dioscorea cayennensis subsp. rotundata TaxID=55577 RepID=A0AB40B2C9_DIOCR|nr:uncharacterized protein LOC120258184 [Dioscorea cayenensis subsp. rotundata]